MSPAWRGALLLLLLAAIVAAPSAAQERAVDPSELRDLGDPRGTPLSGEELEARAQEIGSLLRCPVCQGLSVADSPVPAALAMQAKVERLVGAGYTEEQILAHFETSYGEFIRLSPKPEGFNIVVWVLPVIAILAGVLLVLYRVRTTAVRDEEELEAYRRKVREALDG